MYARRHHAYRVIQTGFKNGWLHTTSSCPPVSMQQRPATKTTLPGKQSSEKSVVSIVDMSLPLDQVGKQIHRACTSTGFFYLANHGVSEDLCHSVLWQAREMFDKLSAEDKEAISVAHSNSYRGYQRMGVNVTRDKRDGHEALDLVSESKAALVRSDEHPKGLTNYGRNQWPNPDLLPLLQPTIEAYIREMNYLGKRLADATSLGLGLGPDFFRPYFSDAYWSMRLIRYPGVSQHNNDYPYEYGVGEHCDYGVFTMILCDHVPRTLQIRTKGSNTWEFVDPIPGTFICNIGDMLARWTNNIYVSTPHRVLPPSQDRFSVPFFFDPNYDSQIAPIETLVKRSGQPPCFDPIMYGDHLLAKTSKNFVL